MRFFKPRKLPNRIGLLLLGIWLIITGILYLHPLHVQGSDWVNGWFMPLLAIVAGILILLNR